MLQFNQNLTTLLTKLTAPKLLLTNFVLRGTIPCANMGSETCSVSEKTGDWWKNAKSVYDFTAKTTTGEEVSLEKYRGHPLLIVNVASQCGYTGTHYKELAELDEKYRESKGLRILAFPCNQFGGQEPGSNEEISCSIKKYSPNFDIFAKIDVNGNNAHPLFKYLKHKQGGLLIDAIKWNFTKFIIDKNGQPVARHAANKNPLDLIPELEKVW
nr:PREDICTED: probable glutathione peroxidase 2 isoform X1 [Bemisia tabaci]